MRAYEYTIELSKIDVLQLYDHEGKAYYWDEHTFQRAPPRSIPGSTRIQKADLSRKAYSYSTLIGK